MSETQMILIIVVLVLACILLVLEKREAYRQGCNDGFRKGYKACAKDYGLKDVDMSDNEWVFKNGAKLTFSKHANPDGDEEGDWQGSDHDEPPKKTYQSNGVKVVSVADPNPDDEDGEEITVMWLRDHGAHYNEDGCMYFYLKNCKQKMILGSDMGEVWQYRSELFGNGFIYNRGELRELFKTIGEPLEKK